MLTPYRITQDGPHVADSSGESLAADWIDLNAPTAEEEEIAERYLGADVPTREEARKIEYSSRFYVENGVIYMTASVLAGVHVGHPKLTPFTFALSKGKLVTVRYEDMKAFQQFLAHAPKPDSGCTDTGGVFSGLIETFISRIAEVLDHNAESVDRLSAQVFGREKNLRHRAKQLSELIGHIGVQGDLASKARESLASIERLIQYATATLPNEKASTLQSKLKLALRDVRSLEDHVNFLLNKITFLLDATLGLVSNQQNQIVSVLTIASTILMPPTLIGTVYGMNFANMPELHWAWGYPAALIAMVVSAVLPYLYFRHRGWF